MENKISIRDIEGAIREAMAGSEIQFSDSVYEEKDGKLRLIIFFNKLFSTNNVVLYTKLLFEVDKNKEYLTENKKGQNFFKYLYDINCQYRMKLIDDINDFKNQWGKIIQGNDFGPNMKILSEFIKQPSFLVNDWFNKNNIKDVSLTGFKYEPKMKIMPCKSLSFHFVLTVNNSDEVELYIRKEGKNDYVYNFNISSENETVEKSDLTTLIQTIGETLKDKFSGKSQNEAFDYVNDEWIPCPIDYVLNVGEEIKVNPKSSKYYGDYIGVINRYLSYFKMYSIDWPDGVHGAKLLEKYEILVRNPNRNNIKWYKKGNFLKEELEIENPEDYIGKKVKILDSSEYKNQAYRNGGDGYGVIIRYNYDKYKGGFGGVNDHVFRIMWTNGDKNVYKLQDIEIVEEEEYTKNTRWFKKGKLIKEELEKGEDYVGKKVKILDSSELKRDAYKKGGDGYGIINKNLGIDFFLIRWTNGYEDYYRLIDIELVEEEEHSKKIRWYKKGKLINEELENGEDYVGKKVKISDNSRHKVQAYRNGGDGYGAIIWYNIEEDYGEDDDYIFSIRWTNEYKDIYRLKDVEFVEEEDYNKKIRWFKNGKLHEKINLGDRVFIKSENKSGILDVINSDWCVVLLDNGLKVVTKISNIEFLDGEKVEPKIRWYKNGKLNKG